MPDQARIVRLEDGLEVLVLEGNAGVTLSSYRATLHAVVPAQKVGHWPEPAPAELREKRFASLDDLIDALRLALGV